MPPVKRVSSSVAPLQSAVPVQIVKAEVVAPPAATTPAPAVETPAPKRVAAPKKTKKAIIPSATTDATVPLSVAPIEVSPVGEEPLVNVVEENVEEDGVATTEEKKRTRRVVSKDSLRTDFDTLWTEFAEELSVKKKAGKKLSLEKYLHKLQGDVYKLLKIRPLGDEKKPRAENNSGFMKPVNISPELANFIKVDTKEPITRVAITKKICEYIKEKELQNPKDRREIIPDPSLKSIFKISEGESEPLTYYSMQKKIQSHIFKV
jgi:chromatin remodeling complex protein RSC6